MKKSEGSKPAGPGAAPGFAKQTGMPSHLKIDRAGAPHSGQTARPGKQKGNAGNEPSS